MDIYLSIDLDDVVLVDFNPYRPTTDPLLFDYPDLLDILETSQTASTNRPRLPILRVIDSKGHPDANRNIPTYGSNMMPWELVEMSHGRSLVEFRETWDEAVSVGLTE